MKKIRHLFIGFSFMILSLTTISSYAQETENTVNTGIEEIIVTARQQSESLQDVPVTVSVMSEVDLDRYNITSLTDAAKMVPNFRINAGGSGNDNGGNLVLSGGAKTGNGTAGAVNISGTNFGPAGTITLREGTDTPTLRTKQANQGLILDAAGPLTLKSKEARAINFRMRNTNVEFGDADSTTPNPANASTAPSYIWNSIASSSDGTC